MLGSATTPNHGAFVAAIAVATPQAPAREQRSLRSVVIGENPRTADPLPLLDRKIAIRKRAARQLHDLGPHAVTTSGTQFSRKALTLSDKDAAADSATANQECRRDRAADSSHTA